MITASKEVVPDEVAYSLGVVLGATVFHPSVEKCLLDFAAQRKRAIRNAERRARRRAEKPDA